MNIKLKSLYLKNFKGVADLTINFSENTNIYGANGTGKTSIADGFTYLLFNKDSKDRTDFNIKTLDKEGNIIHHLEHIVEGTLLINDRELTLRKELKEKWTKKRGELEKKLTSNETTYFINDIPVKRNEYQNEIAELIQENIFKLITNPFQFNALNWKDRRNVLINMVDNIDNETILNSNLKLEDLREDLRDKSIDDFKKSTISERKKLSKDLDGIPVRISEIKNHFDSDINSIKEQLLKEENEYKNIEDILFNSSQSKEDIKGKQTELNNLKIKLHEEEFILKLKGEEPKKELNNEILEINYNIKSLEKENSFLSSHILTLNDKKLKLDNELNSLRTKFYEFSKKDFAINEEDLICPTCKREVENSETKKIELEENFNLNKAKKLKEINDSGKFLKTTLLDLEKELEVNKNKINDIENNISTLNAKKIDLEDQLNNFNIVIDKSILNAIQEKINILEEDLRKLTSSDNIDNLILLRNDKKNIIDSLRDKINSNKKMETRILELKDLERELSIKVTNLEKKEMLIDLFITTKVNLLEKSINIKFKNVTFKLFDKQMNDGISECCETLVDGVPYDNSNTASQINSGINIINTLNNYYSVNAPIFIDNAESVNQITDTKNQLIKLYVSDDTSLKIENN